MLADDSREVFIWTLTHRIAVAALLIVASRLQIAFDSSTWLLLRLDKTSSSSFTTSLSLLLTRWDTLHFLAQASPRPIPLARHEANSGLSPAGAVGGGLQYDYSFAFQPGIVWLLRLMGYRPWYASEHEAWSPAQAAIVVSVLTTAMGTVLPLMLYHLSMSLFSDRRFSRIVALLSILSPSPCSLITPTPEPIFAFFSLLGQLALRSSSSHYITSTLAASIFFALATFFRSNGILFIGFILWASFWQQSNSGNRFRQMYVLLVVMMCLLPLLLSQYFAWSRFCTSEPSEVSWCLNGIPSIYTFVQGTYWGVGPLRYWRPSQLPNWLMAMPVLTLSGYWVNLQYSKDYVSVLRHTAQPNAAKRQSHRRMSLLAHAHYTLVFLLLLTLASHVQIVLRFASPGGLPALWWGAASVVQKINHYSKASKETDWSTMVITYLIFWNITSIFLFAGFYPPA